MGMRSMQRIKTALVDNRRLLKKHLVRGDLARGEKTLDMHYTQAWIDALIWVLSNKKETGDKWEQVK